MRERREREIESAASKKGRRGESIHIVSRASEEGDEEEKRRKIRWL
jgi:hypothetical protein